MRVFNEIGLARQVTYPPGSTFGPRRMKDFEFVWIDRGFVVYECDGERYESPRGSLILAKPGVRDSFIWDPAKETQHSFVHFSLGADLAIFFPESPPVDRWPVRLTLSDKNIVFPLFEHLRYVQSQESVNRDLEQHCMLQILLAFINEQCLTVEGNYGDLHPAIQRVFSYLQGIWTESSLRMPSIDELIRASGVSEGHLGRLFHEAFGMSPGKAIRTLRMERAGEYLVRSNMQVQEISDILHCDNAFHFSRSFKSVHGRSPKEFREYFRAHPQELAMARNFPWSGLGK